MMLLTLGPQVITRDDLAARIALVPMVQEARGLDAGPRFVQVSRVFLASVLISH